MPVDRSRSRDGRRDLGVRKHRLDDVVRGQLITANRNMHVFHCAVSEPRQGYLQLLVLINERGPFGGRLHKPAAKLDVLAAQRVAGGTANGGAGTPGDRDALPRGWRHVAFRGQDHDFVAVAQHRRQRQLPAIDQRADTAVADVGVHGIGEINRRRAARQSDDPAFRREGEHLILEQLELGMLEKVL